MQHHISCHVGLSCHDQEGKRAAPQFLSCWPFVPRPEVQACSTTVPVMLACRATTRRAGVQHHSSCHVACHATTRRAGVQHHNSCHVGLSCHDQEGRRAAPQFLSCWPVVPRPGGHGHAAPQYENFSTLQSLSSITISNQTLP